MIERTEEEIQEMADKAADNKRNWSGMTYQEGVRAALDWVIGNTTDSPIED